MTKLLIVDDKEQDLYMLQVLLKSSGYEVITASNGQEGLEKAKIEGPDMIISDILMPVMDGLTFCRYCKKDDKLKRIPFVFYTATYTDDKDRELAMSLGVERFLIKPMEPDVFVNVLREVIMEYEEGCLVVPKKLIEEEAVYLKKYSEVLVRKLEDKMLQLEGLNKMLKESEKKYRELIDNANDGIIVVEPTGYFSFVNPKFSETTGYSQEEALKLHITKLVHPEDISLVTENFEKAMSGQVIPKNYEFRVLTATGEVIPVELNATPIERDKEIVRVQAIVRDITQRKQTEEELKQTCERLQIIQDETVNALATTAEMRDPYTAGHQRRVTQLASAIAHEMGLSEEQIEGIIVAGTLHDIGKIYVPAEILNKPGRITENEFNIIKTHPQVGYEILKTIEFPWPVAQIVLQHHERMDGSGYSSGLEGEDILLEARILAVADVIEAMASHRPYRSALGIDKALEEITKNRGSYYDPEVVDACLNLFASKRFQFKE